MAVTLAVVIPEIYLHDHNGIDPKVVCNSQRSRRPTSSSSKWQMGNPAMGSHRSETLASPSLCPYHSPPPLRACFLRLLHLPPRPLLFCASSPCSSTWAIQDVDLEKHKTTHAFFVDSSPISSSTSSPSAALLVLFHVLFLVLLVPVLPWLDSAWQYENQAIPWMKWQI